MTLGTSIHKTQQLWLKAGRLGKLPLPVKPFYSLSVTHWRRHSMPASCTVEAYSLLLVPLLTAYQL